MTENMPEREILVEIRRSDNAEVIWAGRLEDVGEAVPPQEPEPPGRLDVLMASERRRTFDLERDTGVTPTLSSEDVEFVRNLRSSPGGFDPDGTWLLPSGLPLNGREIADLPDET